MRISSFVFLTLAVTGGLAGALNAGPMACRFENGVFICDPAPVPEIGGTNTKPVDMPELIRSIEALSEADLTRLTTALGLGG